MNLRQRLALRHTRRQFLRDGSLGLGAAALAAFTGQSRAQDRSPSATGSPNPLVPRPPQFAAKAKRVIYLHMSGAPPQQDLFDYKPKLNDLHMKPCPDELIAGMKFPFIKGHPKLLGCPHKFERRGQSGAWVSELLPHFTKHVD